MGIDKPLAGPVSDLRMQLLAAARAGSAAELDGPLWGVVSEFGFAGGSATLVAFDDGSCSMYTSEGGGVIEAGTHDAVRGAAAELLAVADRVAPALPVRTDTREARPGEVSVFLLFADRVVGVRAPRDAPNDDGSASGELRAAAGALLDRVRDVAADYRP